MKLYFVPSSPYARKVRVAAVELGCDGEIEDVNQPPRDNSTGFHTLHPLARIPVLQTDDGEVFFDSPVICEYLNDLKGGRLFPKSGPARWSALRRQAIGDGMLDALLPWRGEQLRPNGSGSKDIMDRHKGAVSRMLDALEARSNGPSDADPDIGDLAIGSALGYLDFRFADWPWRDSHPKLAAWFAKLNDRPSFQKTQHH